MYIKYVDKKNKGREVRMKLVIRLVYKIYILSVYMRELVYKFFSKGKMNID